MSDQPNSADQSTSGAELDEAERQRREYINHLINTGKAAVAQDGKLPLGATHEIVGKDANGVPILVRRRFS